jgi:alpha-tubulin suppressor-like RCC1 family protein
LAISLDKNVYAWGNNRSFQLGLGEKMPCDVFIPTLVPIAKNVIQISCGTEHSVALTKDSKVFTWG